MSDVFDGLPFRPAEILLPRNCEYHLWSVVACDQYTSQPEYWQRVEERVGRAPSTLRLILPESCLEGPEVETDIMEINNTMARYVRDGRFTAHPDCMIYVERTLSSGCTRRGLVGMVDLDQYDYEPGSAALVRCTEETVYSRIPPRVAVRKNALIELPHVQLLMDDPKRSVIEPLSGRTGEMEAAYDFDFMEGGGHIRGWMLTEEQKAQVAASLRRLADPDVFRARYKLPQDAPTLLFAMGDGNHSLATAKECWERQKRLTPPDQWDRNPARFALCELNNLHDEAIRFQPIHRVLFGVEPEVLLEALLAYFPNSYLGAAGGGIPCNTIPLRFGVCSELFTIPEPKHALTTAAVQEFLDAYLETHPEARVDYIHGVDVAVELASRPNSIAFLLSPMGKEELFPAVIHSGALPKKTFSLGEAQDKRFYLEARKIRL